MRTGNLETIIITGVKNVDEDIDEDDDWDDDEVFDPSREEYD